MENNYRIGIVGAGSFGTSLAAILAKKGCSVSLWARRAEQVSEMRQSRQNGRYLPDVTLPENILCTSELEEAVSQKELVIFAVPAQTFRGVLESAVPYLDDGTPLVNVAKGIERGTLLRMSEIAGIVAACNPYVSLSGPSHAEEVARELPTTVAVSCRDRELAGRVQSILSTEAFRVYTNDDMAGVELGGALKNIIALCAGISDGIGFGDNAKAALMTRGITEITRLGVRMGARSETFSGLTGVGDLIVTCTSVHSRNRRCGIMIGEGMAPEEAVKRVGMVVEGISTAEAARLLAKRLGVEMPITESLCRVIDGKLNPREAVKALMTRDLKKEMTDGGKG